MKIKFTADKVFLSFNKESISQNMILILAEIQRVMKSLKDVNYKMKAIEFTDKAKELSQNSK
jgi:hypothetical protein